MVIAFLPNNLFTAIPVFKAKRASPSTALKFFAIFNAILFAVTE